MQLLAIVSNLLQVREASPPVSEHLPLSVCVPALTRLLGLQ